MEWYSFWRQSYRQSKNCRFTQNEKFMRPKVFDKVSPCLFPVFLIVLSIGFSSCGSYRKVIKEPLKTYGPDYLLEQMKGKEIRPDYFTARFSADIQKDRQDLSFNGQLRLKHDSIIWLTLSPALGLEAGRLIITADSVKWMNRLESNYLAEDANKMAELIHPYLDFDLLQSLILGNDLSYYDNSMFKGSIENHEYKLSVMHRRKLRKQAKGDDRQESIPMQQIWLNPETYRITRVLIKDLQDKDAKIDAEFQRFVQSGDHLFSVKRHYQIQGKGSKIRIRITFSRPEIPETCSFPFNIPEKYLPVSN